MVLFSPEAYVWLEHGEDAFIPVQMIRQAGERIIAKASTGEQYELDVSKSYPEVHPSSLRAVENMVAMEELSEAAILHNLRLRFTDNLIYTHISSILVSINPFKQLPIYSPAIMKEYREKLARMERVAPHVYALADAAFTNLRSEDRNQSVIISGESGAGKTEATKLVLQYMAECSGQGNDVEQQLLSSNPIVEAFGNAKTVRNNNSSRFGKLVEIKFNDRFHIVGADIKNYLLEKSRIVVPGMGERNYHLFYQLCAGATPAEREKWHLDHAGKFRILSVGGTLEVDGTDDADDYKQLRHAFDILNFTAGEVDSIMRVTSACLHLGNLDFAQNAKDEAAVSNADVLATAAKLLQVDAGALGKSLVSQRKMMGRDSILTVKNKVFAESARDALTKKIYSNMFNWLITRINKTLGSKSGNANRVVGVLDIFGFEIFNVNRFEQLCINFANEKMQQHFNSHIFEMEQREYASEKIDVAHVSYVDNQPCLDLIENGKGSILGMSDEELKLPGGGDDNLLARMHQSHAANKYYTKPKTMVPIFTIAHYAGPVEYTIEGFVEKNRDSLEGNIAEVLQASSMPFVAQLIPAEAATRTLGSQFKAQLMDLMLTLNKTSPHFIRCIKSNNLKVSDTFDSQMVLRQLRYLGLKEVVNIRQLGYPIRREHKEFVRRYGLLCPGSTGKGASSDHRAVAQKILATALPAGVASEKDWRVGVSKVFLRQNLSTLLEGAREKKLTRIAIFLQSRARTKIWRSRFLRVKGAIDHLKKCMDDPNSTPEQLDQAISLYEGLKFKTNTKLIQAAIKIRNRLFEQAQARTAVASALKSMDVETMRTAIFVAEKALLEESTCEPFRKLKELFTQLQAYRVVLEGALAAKSTEQLRQALARAKELGVNGPDEKRALSMLTSLEEEARAAAKLAEEKRAREIEQLKKAVQAAMTAKSGAMLDAAIKKALLDPSLGLAQDKLILDGQKLVTTLDKEVKAFNLAQELKAAIESEDVSILEQTIAIAMDKGFQNHALTIQARELVAKFRKRDDLLAMLSKAVQSKNDMAIKLALTAVNTPANIAEFPQLMSMAEVRNAQQVMSDLIAGKSAKKLTDAEAKEAALAHALDALRAATESKNQQLLEAALATAKAAGISKDSEQGGAGELFTQATKLLLVVQSENEMRRQELLHANASVKAEHTRSVRRSLILTGQQSLLTQDVAAERSVDLSFDPAVYSKDEYALANYPDLRSVNDFAGEKKNLRLVFLRHSKEIIPKSLSKFENQGAGVSSMSSPRTAGSVASAMSTGGDVWPEKMLSEKSVELFKMIQGFMLDRQYSFPDTLVAELFTEMLLYPALRNEVYAQIIKQLTNNTENIESFTRGWMLLCLLVDALPPLSDFLNYLLHFVHGYVSGKQDVVAQAASPAHLELAANYAAYALHKLKVTCLNFRFSAPRKDSPELARALQQREANQPIECLKSFASMTSVEHIAAFRERTMVPASCRIHLPDGSQIQYTAAPWQSNKDVVAALCEQIGLKDADYYALYEMRGTDMQYLYASDNLLDVQLQWSKQERKEALKKSKGFFSSLFNKKEKREDDFDEWAENPGVRRFLLKRRVYPKNVGTDPAGSVDKLTLTMMFHTVQMEVMLGLHTVDEDTALRLATIARTLADSGVLKPLGPLPKLSVAAAEATDTFAIASLSDVPQGKIAKSVEPKKWLAKIEKLQPSLPNQSLDLWMDTVKKLDTFPGAFYTVYRPDDPSVPGLKLPNDLVVFINYFGVRLLDRKTRQVLDHFPLLNVLGWSASPIRFTVKLKLNKPIGAGVNMVTFRFNTYNPKMAKEMCDLLYAYATEMLKAVGIKG